MKECEECKFMDFFFIDPSDEDEMPTYICNHPDRKEITYIPGDPAHGILDDCPRWGVQEASPARVKTNLH